jgi:hypothetical protein
VVGLVNAADETLTYHEICTTIQNDVEVAKDTPTIG